MPIRIEYSGRNAGARPPSLVASTPVRYGRGHVIILNAHRMPRGADIERENRCDVIGHWAAQTNGAVDRMARAIGRRLSCALRLTTWAGVYAKQRCGRLFAFWVREMRFVSFCISRARRCRRRGRTTAIIYSLVVASMRCHPSSVCKRHSARFFASATRRPAFTAW